jgi:prepilin-type N-terminal cleavage/methylation domain-containing protein
LALQTPMFSTRKFTIMGVNDLNILRMPSCSRKVVTGFTLIELLASMAILSLIVLLLARVFAESSAMWEAGEKRMSSASEGRVIMDFLVREFSLAIADDIIAFRANSDADAVHSIPSYGALNDEIAFIAMTRPGISTGEFRRTSNAFMYFVTEMRDEDNEIMPNRFRLVRTRLTRALYLREDQRQTSAYTYPPTSDGRPLAWWEHMPGADDLSFIETIAENVAAFDLWSYGIVSGDGAISDIFSYDSRSVAGSRNLNRLPVYVDIYLELLGEAQARQAAELWDLNRERAREFIDQNVQRFTARVEFPNRDRASAF